MRTQRLGRADEKPGDGRSGSTALLGVSLYAVIAGCSADRVSDAESDVADCTPRSASGPNPIRRLTRFEYGRSVAALTGVDPAVADALPPDEESLGFLNNADAYSVSTLHAAKYLEVAESVADAFVSDGERLGRFAQCASPIDRDCAAEFIRSFGRQAFRRPLESEELEAMVALYDATAEAEPMDGLRAVVAALLQSPQFLYRPEPVSTAPDGAVRTSYALATRLAYLLTASPPDDELLAAAEGGALVVPSKLEEETERLLAGTRALSAFSHFLSQWWELGGLEFIEKDTKLYHRWRPDLRTAFAEETASFVSDAWARGPSLKLLLTASHTFADASLASYYGYPEPAAAGYQRLELDPARAAGLLTQGALLATHAKPDQTSPIHRGKFVRARLLCQPPPPPPPNIVVRAPTVNPRLSTRERFQQHAEDPSCAGCHELMDPIGFAFEHYDAAGRYRAVDGGKPVDARGWLVGTDVDGEFEGVPELAARLLDSEQVRDCVATQWFRYAFGRSEQTPADACTIQTLSVELERGNGDLRAMMRATVRQPQFHWVDVGETPP